MRLKTEGILIDTSLATASYEEATRFDGSNHISVNTGSQWTHQTLYCSRKGRWYLIHSSQWQGSRPEAEFISDDKAAAWLELNNHELPEGLESQAE